MRNPEHGSLEWAEARVRREAEEARADWQRLMRRYPAAAEYDQLRAMNALLDVVFPEGK